MSDAELEAAIKAEVESSGWTLKSIEWTEPEGFEGYRNYPEEKDDPHAETEAVVLGDRASTLGQGRPGEDL